MPELLSGGVKWRRGSANGSHHTNISGWEICTSVGVACSWRNYGDNIWQLQWGHLAGDYVGWWHWKGNEIMDHRSVCVMFVKYLGPVSMIVKYTARTTVLWFYRDALPLCWKSHCRDGMTIKSFADILSSLLNHWKPRVVIMQKLSSMVAPQVLVTTACSTTSHYERVGYR